MRRCSERGLPQGEFSAKFRLILQEFYDRLKAEEDREDLSDVFKAVYKEVDKKMKDFEYVGSTATTVCVWKYQGKNSTILNI